MHLLSPLDDHPVLVIKRFSLNGQYRPGIKIVLDDQSEPVIQTIPLNDWCALVIRRVPLNDRSLMETLLMEKIKCDV